MADVERVTDVHALTVAPGVEHRHRPTATMRSDLDSGQHICSAAESRYILATAALLHTSQAPLAG
jgi:hypothetical protein